MTNLNKLLAKKNTIIVDMRSPVEYRDGHIPNAVNKNLRQLTTLFGASDKTVPVVIYGDSETTTAAVRYLTVYGFVNIYVIPNYSKLLPVHQSK